MQQIFGTWTNPAGEQGVGLLTFVSRKFFGQSGAFASVEPVDLFFYNHIIYVYVQQMF